MRTGSESYLKQLSRSIDCCCVVVLVVRYASETVMYVDSTYTCDLKLVYRVDEVIVILAVEEVSSLAGASG